MIRERPDAVVCDLDGVVYRGDEPIPDSVEALERLRESGIRILFCTNNSRSTVGQYVAKRKEVKAKDGAVDHVWTFDLTSFAQTWIKEFTTNTSVMLVGNPPKGYKPGDTDQQDTWRTVLTGPKAPGGTEGVKAEIEFIPAEIEPPPPPTTGTTGTVGTTGTTGTISTGSTGDISTGSTDFGSSGSIGDSGSAAPPTEPAAEGEAPIAAAGAEQTPQGMPGYVWLALLAGLMAWSVFRSAVLENAKGIRPDGVLAQIQRLNSQRRGGEAVAVAAAGPSAISSVLSNVKGSAGSLFEKLKITKKG